MSLVGVEELDLQSVQGAEEYRFLFNGKERETALSLHLYDFHARQQDPQLGRFWGVDAHADSYYPWSPYNQVGNNPINIIDPDGKDWDIVIDFENKNITITFTGKLIDETGTLGSQDLQSYADRMNEALSTVFSGNTSKDFTVNIVSNISVLESNSDLQKTDHSIYITENVPGTEKEAGFGYSEIGGLFIYINKSVLENKPATEGEYAGTGLDANGNPTLERTFTHEAGHTAGLYHPGRGTNCDCQANVNLGAHQITEDKFSGKNLMYQSWRNNKPNPLAGYSLIPEQLSSIAKRIYDTKKGFNSPNAKSLQNISVNNPPQKHKSRR
ncbi:MAG: hypothetical protein JJT94_14720 [Bernardetiaceae bacterium]|nr:hypothetical protein [Bernardetiaceae bacterium]